jgi:hypothetical protein
VASHARERGAATVEADFLPTQRNQATLGLYRDHGFNPVNQMQWRLDLAASSLTIPPWFQVRTFEPADAPRLALGLARTAIE